MSNQKIKFDLSQEGAIHFHKGKTGFADILSIGALKYTSRRIYEPNSATLQYQTDEAGLDRIIQTAEHAIENINEMVSVLGMLLVGDPDAINESDIRKAGWSLVALSELSAAIDFELSDMRYAQLELSKNKGKSQLATVTGLKKGISG
jgi:hypothetical protein